MENTQPLKERYVIPMWGVVIALFVIYYLCSMPKKRKEVQYVPQFSGYWENDGDDFNEHWSYKTPSFRTRYVNLFQQDNLLYIKLSWKPLNEANEVFKERDQMGAESTMRWLSHQFPEAIIDMEEPIYINIYLEDEIIMLERSTFEGENAWEVVKVLEEEYDEVLEKVKIHFRKYATVLEKMSKFD
ncbi:hypothetical protein [Ornithinibacillus halophilus]|uniref:Uncharacterized protein n=1 Tax=Ornithinibacillus halophilus TaxID=930117 RepID=A0A1M5GLV4_9BACI|nr:hypothetical protein [Ornithinibacillus halophilus]SHG04663.1 hypothetical protein SAMN05216225_101364 [Ornithinibacillus halophilus]